MMKRKIIAAAAVGAIIVASGGEAIAIGVLSISGNQATITGLLATCGSFLTTDYKRMREDFKKALDESLDSALLCDDFSLRFKKYTREDYQGRYSYDVMESLHWDSRYIYKYDLFGYRGKVVTDFVTINIDDFIDDQ